MGIEDRDWFREKKLNYDRDDSYDSNRFSPRNGNSFKTPSLFWSVIWVLIIFSLLGIRVFKLLFPKPHQQAIQMQQTVQKPLSSSDTRTFSPPSAPEGIPPSESPIAQNRPESAVISSSAESQILHYYKKNDAGIKYLTAEINDISFEVVVDTGASNIVLNSDAIKRLGISRFIKKIKTSTAGGGCRCLFIRVCLSEARHNDN